ncbi:ligase-associated DNA damage response DEXH box helicase [Gaopeijia maritima]|uniref:Ligase-associated DNA damage response DEXH box helicase n=1 Tax=Gaopeijia maritima TaxID=3119007 RepID=A0ABU9E850_9BACT
MSAGVDALERWFAERGWRPFGFQREVWRAWSEGESGLLHVPTGLGKTVAAAGGPLGAAVEAPEDDASGLRLLWITPLRALARDTETALSELTAGLGLDWRVERRTGDTAAALKRRQKTHPPEVLITTPESLSLLLTETRHPRIFAALDTVVVDEWHELLGSKRGVQCELGLARLRTLRPDLRTWGLSATLQNLHEAQNTLLGPGAGGRLVGAGDDVPSGAIELRTVLPDPAGPDRFPWAGHLGLRLLEPVLAELDAPGTALLFTNTRSQAELWHRAIVEARPDWADDVLLHHGSLAREARTAAEERLRLGTARCVVCTSTLDLGVDFSPVDRVIQVGSPKGVARLLQRAGRSGHRPGGVRRIVCVPTHALEIVEFAAARTSIEAGSVEPRHPLVGALDVLCQHLVTRALGGGFTRAEIAAEVRSTRAYRDLADSALDWCLDFVTRGGATLEAYPRYHRVVRAGDRFVVESRSVARRHRMSVGTITDDGQMQVRFLKGGRLGRVEERFVSRLSPGDRFLFAGRELELVRTRDMVAWVRLAKGRKARRPVPRWAGGRMPLSTHLAEAVAAALSGSGSQHTPEMAAVAPLLEVQARWSRLPGHAHLLGERHRTREGHHLFLFPFLGRAAHEGLAALVAWRLSQRAPRTASVSANDYGFEIVSPDPLPDDPGEWVPLWSPDRLIDDLHACMNATELARRRFRDVARVSGLVFQGPPGRPKSARQLQASAGLIYDVLARWDPENLLLQQAHREVLDHELEVRRLREGLERMTALPPVFTTPPRLTPLAFPIWAERMQAQVSTESWVDRVRRVAGRLEKAAGTAGA